MACEQGLQGQGADAWRPPSMCAACVQHSRRLRRARARSMREEEHCEGVAAFKSADRAACTRQPSRLAARSRACVPASSQVPACAPRSVVARRRAGARAPRARGHRGCRRRLIGCSRRQRLVLVLSNCSTDALLFLKSLGWSFFVPRVISPSETQRNLMEPRASPLGISAPSDPRPGSTQTRETPSRDVGRGLPVTATALPRVVGPDPPELLTQQVDFGAPRGARPEREEAGV